MNSFFYGSIAAGKETFDSENELHFTPPNPNPYRVKYDDGSESPLLRIKVFGTLGQSSIYEETLDGFTVKRIDQQGKYMYVDVDEKSGDFISTGVVAGTGNSKSLKIGKNMGIKRYDILKGRKERSKERNLNDRENFDAHRKTSITTGRLKNLVIPFKFSDHSDRTLPSRSDLDTLMNNEGPHDTLCPTGSVRDVYLQNSFNQLEVQSTVIDWVTIGYTESYCAGGESGLSKRIHTCLKLALYGAVQAGVNFADFDIDNNGQIDGITFFHSGYAAEFGGIDASGKGEESRIWSHKWSLYPSNWQSNGVRVSTYNINPALWEIAGSNIGRIGTVVSIYFEL